MGCRIGRFVLGLSLAIAPLFATAQTPPPKGNVFNPNLTANLIGLYLRGTGISDDRNSVPHNGLSLQELTVEMAADVDPYMKAFVALALTQEDGTPEYAIEPEEAYLESTSLPRVALRAGKFKLAMGKHNTLHDDAFPFIDGPLINDSLLGEEGLNQNALSAALLLPTNWYSELILQSFDLTHSELFDSPRSGDLGGLAHYKNLWDLNDQLTLELGFSGALGPNQYGHNTSLWGLDLTLKGELDGGSKWAWATEYMAGDRVGAVDSGSGDPIERLGGLSTWLEYHLNKRWRLQGRYDFVGTPRAEALPEQSRQTLMVGYAPSEFSSFRLQVDRLETKGADRAEQVVGLQYRVTIGSHPAHTY